MIFLTFLASFFATALNTMLGVQSIDESYSARGRLPGRERWQVFRHVIIPGALPFIFTGLQISVGVAWFSLVAAEMVSGEYGLGYVINTSYMNVQYPMIIIGMVTLGIVGYATSALVRLAGDYLMQWRVRELALGGGDERCRQRNSQQPRARSASSTSQGLRRARGRRCWRSTTAASTSAPARSA